MAFQALGELLPSRLKRAGIWEDVQTQAALEQCQATLLTVFPNHKEDISCTAIQREVLCIRVRSAALAAEIRLYEKVILQKFFEAKIQGVRGIRTTV